MFMIEVVVIAVTIFWLILVFRDATVEGWGTEAESAADTYVGSRPPETGSHKVWEQHSPVAES